MVEAAGSSSWVARVIRSIVLRKEGDTSGCSTPTASLMAASHPCQFRVPPRPGAALDVVACDAILKVASDAQLDCDLETMIWFGAGPSGWCPRSEVVPGKPAKGPADLTNRDPADGADFRGRAGNIRRKGNVSSASCPS